MFIYHLVFFHTLAILNQLQMHFQTQSIAFCSVDNYINIVQSIYQTNYGLLLELF